MCSYKQTTWRSAERILRRNGYTLDSKRKGKGSHRHYVNNSGNRIIICINGDKTLNPMLWRRLCKENNLMED